MMVERSVRRRGEAGNKSVPREHLQRLAPGARMIPRGPDASALHNRGWIYDCNRAPPPSKQTRLLVDFRVDFREESIYDWLARRIGGPAQ
jgi:hypothetical protein